MYCFPHNEAPSSNVNFKADWSGPKWQVVHELLGSLPYCATPLYTVSIAIPETKIRGKVIDMILPQGCHNPSAFGW